MHAESHAVLLDYVSAKALMHSSTYDTFISFFFRHRRDLEVSRFPGPPLINF